MWPWGAAAGLQDEDHLAICGYRLCRGSGVHYHRGERDELRNTLGNLLLRFAVKVFSGWFIKF